MKGWFDAFRTDGGPTLYHHSNRTAVAGDISTITILIIFVTVFIAFLLIFPGVRSQVSRARGVSFVRGGEKAKERSVKAMGCRGKGRQGWGVKERGVRERGVRKGIVRDKRDVWE